MRKNSDKPDSRRLGRAGIMVAVIILVVMAVVFAGRNLWHAETLEKEEQTGTKERSGLN